MEDYLSFADVLELKKSSGLQGVDEALLAFQRLVLAGKPEEEILEYVFNALGVFVPFDRVGIAVQDGEWLRSRWVKSRVPVEHLGVGYAAKINGSSLERLLKEGKPRIIADLEIYFSDHPESQSTRLILKDGMRSSLTFPLQLRDNSFGVVFFSSVKTGVYSFEHMKLLESVAQGLALVVERADLFRSNEAHQNQKMMLSKILHDLRSPLSVMISFSDLLESSPEFPSMDESTKEMFSVIRTNEQVLWSLVSELSDLAALNANRFSVRKVATPLRAFLGEVARSLKPICERKGLILNLRMDEGVPDDWPFDPLRIRQVLENLISNAAKFSVPGGKVELRIWKSAQRLFLSVTDEGVGIPAADIPKLFLEFGVASVKPTGREPSTGLGLAICRQIVRRHGGEITVRSEPGKGSCFEFWLPFNPSALGLLH